MINLTLDFWPDISRLIKAKVGIIDTNKIFGLLDLMYELNVNNVLNATRAEISLNIKNPSVGNELKTLESFINFIFVTNLSPSHSLWTLNISTK